MRHLRCDLPGQIDWYDNLQGYIRFQMLSGGSWSVHDPINQINTSYINNETI